MRSTQPVRFCRKNGFRIRFRSRLPHFELDNAIYFVTWRLDDALPRHVALELRRRWKDIERALDSGNLTPAAARELMKTYAALYEKALDEGHGSCLLRDARVASMIQDALKHFDGERYDLRAWSVMPNHVHAVFHLELGRDLERVLHSWKWFTGSNTNRILGRKGKLWQKEYFDRIVRDQRELDDTIRYVVENPAAAGLRNWPYAGAKSPTTPPPP